MKAFNIVDIVPYSVKLHWEQTPGGGGDNVALADMDSAVFYKRFSSFPSVKDITFKVTVISFNSSQI